MSKIAIIDMGTNTFHLLIAERSTAGIRMIHRDHEAVKIGRGGINEGVISEPARQRALDAMMKFSASIRDHDVTAVYAFGTSAMRNAKNGSALAHEITACTGIRVRIISGDEEADLIFAGVRSALDLGEGLSLVMDIGAGSVEFIIGDRQQLRWKQSFEIGGQRLLERFQKNDPITGHEIKTLDTFFENTLKPLFKALEEFNPAILVGSSGTFDTLSEIYCRRHGIAWSPDDPETPLTKEAFFEIYRDLIRRNREERMQIPGMITLRVDMIVVACCLIHFMLERHSFECVRVSTYSLKEGALAKLFSGNPFA